MSLPQRRLGAGAPAVAVGLAVFVVYAAGACRTIFVGDSGELVTAVHVLGIPHPTGYPLYVLLGKLWTVILPFGSIAWRMSLFSAAAAALACALLYALARLVSRPSSETGDSSGAIPAATAASTLAFSPTFWGEANIQRVYALSALFVVAATAIALRWCETRSPRTLRLAFFVCGLGAANHTFMGVYAVVLFVYAAALERERLLNVRATAAAAGCFLVGLLPYAYLPLRSMQDPPLDWGNPETLRNFLSVTLRSEFWERAWVKSPGDALLVAGDYLRSFVIEMSWPGAALALVGVYVAWRRRRPVILLLAIMAGNLAIVSAHGSRGDIFIWHRYYIPSYVVAALFVGCGVDWVMRLLPRPLRWLPMILPMFLLVSGWSANDRSRFEIADAYARTVLRSVPPGAHLAASDDNILFSLMYLTMVEGERPDVDLILQGVGGAQPPPMRFDFETERLFFTHHPNWTLEGLNVVPRGLVFEVRRSGAALPDVVIGSDTLPGETDERVPKDYLTRNMIGDFHYMLGFTLAERDWPRAQRELERAAAAAPDNAVLFYNLGLVYQRAGHLDAALAAFERSKQIDPRPLLGKGSASAEAHIAELRGLIGSRGE